MPRAARTKSETGLYHIMLRGMDHRDIFMDDEDRKRFLETLDKVREVSGFKLYAYCLMENHVHLLLQEGTEPLEVVFKRIGISYVYYYNWKHELSGHLFQDRFRSEPIDTDAYFLDVLRYICRNPVEAGLSDKAFEYPWLGCAGMGNQTLLTDDIGKLTVLKNDELIQYVTQPAKTEHLDTTEKKRLTDREAIEQLKSLSRGANPQDITGWSPDKRDRIVIAALESGISIRQVSRLTGISKAVIERIRKQ
ncbi:MAG: transposase [Clostridia bacterium]|nr:transposase [Clostridia bacterium]